MASKEFMWTESYVATVTDDRLLALFMEHCPGKAADALADYLAENAPTDSDLWPILTAIRTEAHADPDDLNDVEYSEVAE